RQQSRQDFLEAAGRIPAVLAQLREDGGILCQGEFFCQQQEQGKGGTQPGDAARNVQHHAQKMDGNIPRGKAGHHRVQQARERVGVVAGFFPMRAEAVGDLIQCWRGGGAAGRLGSSSRLSRNVPVRTRWAWRRSR
ncbi:hypothetical protein DSL68_14030, partial [Staphylococcus xylosus]|nr:hypothetical protein [Staphylococcus xylosus]